jgi:3-hydroxyacyl-[acyl-carrier-protein] dehydratase
MSDEILSAIPHRPPMLLVDAILQRSENRIVCRKTFREDEFFFQGHYPGFPLVPGVILCEAAMQTGAILLSQFIAEGSGVPVATRMNEVKFKNMVRPGETIEMEIDLTERMANAFFLKARITKEGKLAASFEFACALAPVTHGT